MNGTMRMASTFSDLCPHPSVLESGAVIILNASQSTDYQQTLSTACIKNKIHDKNCEFAAYASFRLGHGLILIKYDKSDKRGHPKKLSKIRSRLDIRKYVPEVG